MPGTPGTRKEANDPMAKLEYDETGRLLFTQEMRKEYTILIPQMLPVHFGFFAKLLERTGYHVAILNNDGRSVVDSGLKYVHNDACYPALLVIGQMIDAIQNGGYDPHKVALLITQTGGGCRASNYIHMLRKALEKAGLDYIPVLWPGEEPRLSLDRGAHPPADLRHDVRGPHHERGQPGAAL